MQFFLFKFYSRYVMIINCNCKTDVGFISVCCCCPIGGHTYILFKLYNCVHLSCGIVIPLKGLKYLFESLTLISEYSSPLSSYGQHCREETFVSLRVRCFFISNKFSRSHRYLFLLKPLIVSINSLVVKNFIQVFSSAAFSFH